MPMIVHKIMCTSQNQVKKFKTILDLTWKYQKTRPDGLKAAIHSHFDIKMSAISIYHESIPGLLNKGQKFLCACSRTQENKKNKVGPILWDTLYVGIIGSILAVLLYFRALARGHMSNSCWWRHGWCVGVGGAGEANL